MADEVQPVVYCGAEAFSCTCSLPLHDEKEPHLCIPSACGGMWFGSTQNPETFEVVRLPRLP